MSLRNIIPLVLAAPLTVLASPASKLPTVSRRQADDAELQTHVYMTYCPGPGWWTSFYYTENPLPENRNSPNAWSNSFLDYTGDISHTFSSIVDGAVVEWTNAPSSSNGKSYDVPPGAFSGSFSLIRTESSRDYLDGLNCFRLADGDFSMNHPVFVEPTVCNGEFVCTKRKGQQVAFGASSSTVTIESPANANNEIIRDAAGILQRASERVSSDGKTCDQAPLSVARGGICSMVVECDAPLGDAKEKFVAAIAAYGNNEQGFTYDDSELVVGDGCIELGTCDQANCLGYYCRLGLPGIWQAEAALVAPPGSTDGVVENGNIRIEITCGDAQGEDPAFCSAMSAATSLAGLIPVVGPLFSAVGTAFTAACD